MLQTLPVLDTGLATLVACCVVEFRVVVVMGDDGEFSFVIEGVGVCCEVVEECVPPPACRQGKWHLAPANMGVLDGPLAASLGGNGGEGHTLEWSSDGVRNPQVSLLALRAGLGNSAKVKELVELGDDCLRVVAVGLVACTLGGALPFEGPV